MSKIIKSINIFKNDNDEFSGGYSIGELIANDQMINDQMINDQMINDQMGGGGNSSIFTDLQIPLGLHYAEEVGTIFYKTVNSSVIEDDLFDKLFDMVSRNKSKATRREQVKKHKITHRK